MDTGGRKVSEVEVEAFSKDQGAKEKYRRIQALAVVENGDVLLVAESVSGQVSLIRLEGKNSQPLFIKQIGGAHRPLLITKIIMTTDGKFLLIGRAFSKAFLMKIESSGKVVWEKMVRDEKLSLFLDGLVTDEGDIVLIGSHLARGGETNIWVGKFTPDGDLIDRNNFGGRYSSVAKEKGSGYVLVYDKRGPRGWDIWMRGLRSDLTESWNEKILSEVKVSLPFRIADVPSGDFIVVGSKQSRLWVSRIKEGAKVKWTYMHREEGISWERLWNVDLLSSHDEFFVPFTMIVVNSRAEQRQVIRLIKFLAK